MSPAPQATKSTIFFWEWHACSWLTGVSFLLIVRLCAGGANNLFRNSCLQNDFGPADLRGVRLCTSLSLTRFRHSSELPPGRRTPSRRGPCPARLRLGVLVGSPAGVPRRDPPDGRGVSVFQAIQDHCRRQEGCCPTPPDRPSIPFHPRDRSS